MFKYEIDDLEFNKIINKIITHIQVLFKLSKLRINTRPN